MRLQMKRYSSNIHFVYCCRAGNAFLFPFFISAAFACGALEANNSGQAGSCLSFHSEYFLGALTALYFDVLLDAQKPLF